jgi:putative membrane protein
MMHGYWDGTFGYGMFFGPLVMILTVVAVVFGIVWLMRGVSGSERRENTDSGLATLKERFARGEIDRTEFEDRRKALLGS